MEGMGDVRPLDGSLEVLVSENGDCVARVDAMAQGRLRGAWITVETAQSVSRLSLGLALFYLGVAVLAAERAVAEDEQTDLMAEIEEIVRGNTEVPPPVNPDDIPF